MNETNLQLNKPIQKSKNIWAIVISVILTALIVGSGVFIWQRSILQSTEQNLQKQISFLENQVKQSQQKSQEVSEEQQQNQKANISNETSSDNIQLWAIPIKNENGYSIFEIHQEAKDCISTVNCANEGRDLLTILSADNEVRNQLNLEKYTSNYITNLKNTINSYTNKQNSSSIYALEVCSLDSNTDIVTGYLWPSDESSIVEEGKFAGMMKTEFYNLPVFIVVKNSKVSIFQDDVKLCNSTATGAEVESCKAEFQDEKILWSCFTGLYNRGEGDNMKYWLFDFDNSTPKVWEDIEYN